MKTLYLLVGPPAAGKSTFTQKLPAEMVFHIDEYRYAQDEKLDNRQRNKIAWTQLKDDVAKRMATGQNIVIDATHLYKSANRMYNRLMDQYGYHVRYLDVTPDLPKDELIKVILERNANREITIPEEQVLRYIDRYYKHQLLTIPVQTTEAKTKLIKEITNCE